MNRKELRHVFSTKLKNYLDENNINRKKLSEDLNIAYSRVCDWTRSRTLPNDEEINMIARYFKINRNELFTEYIKDNSNMDYSFEESFEKIKVYDLLSGDTIGGEVVSFRCMQDMNENHIMIYVNSDTMMPKYELGDLVLVESKRKITDITEGDYVLLDKNKPSSIFIHIYCKENEYLITPLNINNTQSIMPFTIIKKDLLECYFVNKVVSFTRNIK